eukprot:scaffold14590_cov151-Skeletonema_dohrnii-CCMP3373.AAC.2
MGSSNIKKDCDECQGRQVALSASAHISRDQIGAVEREQVFIMPIQDQEEDRVPLTIDASNLNEEELDELKTIDPFMYYSIPSIRNASLRGSMSSSSQSNAGPSDSGRQLQHRRQSAPAALLSTTTDVTAETAVRRRSRISFELSFDEMMSEYFGGLDVGDDDESFESD